MTFLTLTGVSARIKRGKNFSHFYNQNMIIEQGQDK
jgi:hypothetical protein